MRKYLPTKCHLKLLLLSVIVVKFADSWCELTKFQTTEAITCVDYSADRAYIATTSSTKVTIWDAKTKERVHVETVSNAQCAKFSTLAATNKLAISDSSTDIHIFDLTSFTITSTFNSGHGSGFVHLQFNSDDTKLLTCGGSNNKVREWTLSSTASPTKDITVTNNIACAYNTGSNRFAVSASNNKVYYRSWTATFNTFNVD